MKETLFKATTARLLRKSFLCLVPLYCQIGFNVYILVEMGFDLKALTFFNLIWGIISLPCLWICINHFRHSINVELKLRYNTLEKCHNDDCQELFNNKIDRVVIHSVTKPNFSPRTFFEYYEFFQGNKVIKISNFTLNISDLWLDSLSRRIKTDNIERKTSLFPLIRKST